MLLNRGALTCVQCIKVFGGESEIAASNMPLNILKILACTCKRKKQINIQSQICLKTKQQQGQV